jgi:NAD(P)-dependent dehydrogenase (short-subunit alcohol dehydrogenase family)
MVYGPSHKPAFSSEGDLDMPDLSGRITLVTGASRGVGRGIAVELGAAGATVYVTGRSTRDGSTTENLPETIDETAELVNGAGGEGIAVRCDHSAEEQVSALFARIRQDHGRLDLLVNNAWGGYEAYDPYKFQASFWTQPLEYWDGMFTAGVRATYLTGRSVAPLMIERKSGAIINISSGDRGQYFGSLLYDVSKRAIDRMTYGMAMELKKYGIAVIGLYPGFTRTERVMALYKGDLSVTESPHYPGRAVAHLAADAKRLDKTGTVFRTGDLAREYGFTDIDGRQVPPFDLGDEPKW